MIKALITDVDGVLTDGGYYCDDKGLAFKKFNTRDAAAVHRLKMAGIKFVVVTSCDDEITKKRIARMRPDCAVFGIEDKLTMAREICMEEFGLTLDQVAYIGDDQMDAPLLKAAGYSYCPDDATIGAIGAVKDAVCWSKGGEGVLAEVVDVILRSQGHHGKSKKCEGNILRIHQETS